MAAPDMPRLSVRPEAATPGARVDLSAATAKFQPGIPEVRIGDLGARVVFASPSRVGIVVPEGTPGGWQKVAIEGLDAEGRVLVGRPLVSGVHQVDSPVFDREGNLFVTDSGSRGEEVPVSIFKVTPDGGREPFVSGIINATSLAFDRAGDLFVSSRFEGTVYKVRRDGSREVAATDLGVACGLAFTRDGDLLVGDRSGTVLLVDRSGRARRLTSLPPSPAAYHLALGPDGMLFVTAPTLSARDPVFRIDMEGHVEQYFTRFGRPQGLAFDGFGRLHACDALAGSSGVFLLEDGARATQVAAGTALIGVTFDPWGHLVACTNDTVYSFAP
ncbi:MAG: gluconolaconase [Vicinamibacterales bacterium]